MNFLAHLYLTNESPESIIGNIMPDLVRGPLPGDINDELRAAVQLHRDVDRFTDSHAITRRSCNRIRHEWGHYSGVLIDMFFDHLLAKRWDAYSTVPLEAFAEQIYETLTEHAHILPPSMKHAVSRMVEFNWLVSYRDIDGIETALRRMSGRLKRPVRLDDAVVALVEHGDAFSADFTTFFPHVVELARKSRQTTPQHWRESSRLVG
jgi:acyl carrier protein phosphodiesterase